MATALAQTTQLPVCSVDPSRAANGRSVAASARGTVQSRGAGDTSCGDIPMASAPPPAHCSDPGSTPIIPSRTSSSLPDGAPYPGVLVADILEYRALRTDGLRLGGMVGATQSDRCALLEASLRSRDEGQANAVHNRAYHRFDISLPAALVIAEDGVARLVDVEVQNISAGGVKLRANLDPPRGQSVALLIEHPDGALVKLPARVAWGGTGDTLGLMFAGAPVWGMA